MSTFAVQNCPKNLDGLKKRKGHYHISWPQAWNWPHRLIPFISLTSFHFRRWTICIVFHIETIMLMFSGTFFYDKSINDTKYCQIEFSQWPAALQVLTLTNEGGRLKGDKMLTIDREFKLLPESVWKAVSSWYGSSTALPRTVSRRVAFTRQCRIIKKCRLVNTVFDLISEQSA